MADSISDKFCVFLSSREVERLPCILHEILNRINTQFKKFASFLARSVIAF